MYFSNFDRYIVRKPVFHFAALFREDGTTKDTDTLISEFLENKVFKSAVYWSSPQLYDTMIKYQNNELKEIKKSRLLNALKKYIIRSATRSIPYGTFAGVSIMSLHHKSIPNDSPSTLYKKAQLDRAFFSDLIRKIENSSQLKTYLRYHINPSIFIQPLKYRYFGLVDGDYHLNSVDRTEIIDIVFQHLSAKSDTIAEIAKVLPKEFEIEELNDFIQELIDIQFIQSEISETLYTQNELDNVESFLNRHQASDESYFFLGLIKELRSAIETANNTPLSSIPFSKLNRIKSGLKSIGIESQCLLHADLKHSSIGIEPLNKGILKDIKKTINFLYHLETAENIPFFVAIKEFKRKYTEVYELSETPLMQVLDPEKGIGFPAIQGVGTHYNDPFIDKLTAPDSIRENNKRWAPSWLVELIEKSQQHQAIDLSAISLPQKDISTPLPPTFYVLGSILEGNQFFLQNAGGASGKTLFGRFTHLDHEIEKLYKDISTFEKEYNPGAITADIIFIPNGKVANVTRPVNTAEYEINIVGESIAENIKIKLDDLLISVIDDEIIIRSKKLNKRIIPRLSNAHNFAQSNNIVYNFLASIQHQGTLKIGWSFDYLASKKPYIPQIRYGNIVLQRAAWIFYQDDVQAILHSKSPVSALQHFLRKQEVLQFVFLIKGDHELFIDTYNYSYIEILLDEFRKSSTMILCECLFQTPPPKDRYLNQVIIPLKNLKVEKQILPPDISTNPTVQKIFLPGSQWIYFKMYCSASFSDLFLSETIAPLLHKWLEEKIIEKAFFIRYQDPDYHIRFRVLLSDCLFFSSVVAQVHEKTYSLAEQGSILKVELSTYTREVERYGSQHIEDIETCFSYDTRLILQLLSSESFSEDPQLRTLLAIKNIDYWLSYFGFTSQQKLEYCKKMEVSFEKEYSKVEKLNIYNEYRNFNAQLYEVMSHNIFNDIFEERNSHLESLNPGFQNITHLIHMSINRWFPAKQRLYEYLIYIFAVKYYSRKLNE